MLDHFLAPKKMPRSTRKNARDDDALDTELENGNDDQPELPPSLDDADRDVDSVIAELGQEASFVSLRRLEAGDWVILDRLDVGDATAVAIKARFGGGKYRARIHDDSGTFRKQVTFRIGGKSKSGDDDESPDLAAKISNLEAQLAAARNPPSNGNVDGDRRDRLFEAVIARVMTPPAVDPLMGTLITALIGGRATGGGIDPIKLQELLQEAESKGYERGKELGEALSGVAGDSDLGTTLAKSLPEVFRAIQHAAPAPIPAPKPVPIPAPLASPATSLPNPPQSENGNVTDPIALYLRPVVPIILKWAQAGKNPEVKAINMLDDLSDTQRDSVGLAAERDDFVAVVMNAIPEFRMTPEIEMWCRAFFTTIQNTLAPPDDENATQGLEA